MLDGEFFPNFLESFHSFRPNCGYHCSADDLHFLLKLDKNINMYRINKCIQLQIHYFNRKNVHIEYMISVYILNQQLKQSRVNHKIML